MAEYFGAQVICTRHTGLVRTFKLTMWTMSVDSPTVTERRPNGENWATEKFSVRTSVVLMVCHWWMVMGLALYRTVHGVTCYRRCCHRVPKSLNENKNWKQELWPRSVCFVANCSPNCLSYWVHGEVHDETYSKTHNKTQQDTGATFHANGELDAAHTQWYSLSLSLYDRRALWHLHTPSSWNEQANRK